MNNHRPVLSCSILALALIGFAPLAYTQTTVFELQGDASQNVGSDEDHDGRARNYFSLGDDEGGIYATASDWAGGHNFDFSSPWPSSDGVIGWSYWNAGAHDLSRRGPETLNASGQRVYRNTEWDPDTDPFEELYAFYDTDADAPASGFEKLYYLNDIQTIGPIQFGNNGKPDGLGFTNDRQNVLLSEFKLEGAHDGGFGSQQLVSATYTIWIDDVIVMDLSDDPTQHLPTQAFVNVYEGDADLANFAAVQSKFDLSDESTAADTVDLQYFWELGNRYLLISDDARNRAFASEEQLERFRFDFDVTEEIAGLLDDGAYYAGITLAGTPDGDFTLGSLDEAVVNGDTVLENYLPMLTLEFINPLLLGDADGDGDVDAFDITAVEQNFGNTGAADGSLLGDADHDGDVDAFDITAVEQNFGSTLASSPPPTGTAAVPEPGSLAILGLGGLLATRRRFRPKDC